LSCADVQGYYFSHPLSVEAIGPLLTSGTIGRPEVAASAAELAVAYVEDAGPLQSSGSEDVAATDRPLTTPTS
jgi:hypothetical protein